MVAATTRIYTVFKEIGGVNPALQTDNEAIKDAIYLWVNIACFRFWWVDVQQVVL